MGDNGEPNLVFICLFNLPILNSKSKTFIEFPYFLGQYSYLYRFNKNLFIFLSWDIIEQINCVIKALFAVSYWQTSLVSSHVTSHFMEQRWTILREPKPTKPSLVYKVPGFQMVGKIIFSLVSNLTKIWETSRRKELVQINRYCSWKIINTLAELM